MFIIYYLVPLEKEKMTWLIGVVVVSFVVFVLLMYYDQRKSIQSSNKFAFEMSRLIEELQELVDTDPLTRLLNRRSFEREFGRLLMLLSNNDDKRHPSIGGLAVLFVDLDHFKRINDTYGHAIGDEVLQKVAATIKANLRESDLVCRWGGEELVVVLPGVYIPEAMDVAEKLRQAISSTEFSVSDLRVTASLGVTATKQSVKQCDLIERADQALYEAKETGRNRVVSNHH